MVDRDYDAVRAIPENECPAEYLKIEKAGFFIRVIEKSHYDKALVALKEIINRAERPETNNHLASVARQALVELGEKP